MMKQLSIIGLLIIAIQMPSLAQNETLASRNWETLAQVDYEKSEDEYGELFVPVFGKDIRDMEGKEITLPGYIIPFEGMFKPDHIIISSLPVAACFFCGSGGPESVAEVYLSDPIKYTANAIKVTGKLKLNDTDFNQLMYILEDARMEGPAN